MNGMVVLENADGRQVTATPTAARRYADWVVVAVVPCRSDRRFCR